MNTRLPALILACLWTGAVCAAEEKAADEDNKFLGLILTRTFPDGGYTVVESKTGFFLTSDSDEVESQKKKILETLKVEGQDLAPLLERLIKRNAKPAPLTLPSAPDKGYIIDRDGAFEKYFKEGGGGWEQWYKEHPKAHGSTTVSLPAYDAASGLVLVYTATQNHWKAGAGGIILYKFKDGKLEELKKVGLWVS